MMQMTYVKCEDDVDLLSASGKSSIELRCAGIPSFVQRAALGVAAIVSAGFVTRNLGPQVGHRPGRQQVNSNKEN